MTTYLEATPIADYTSEAIRNLIHERGWTSGTPYERIGAAYTFVKDEILFGYNRSDDLSASQVLRDGYGQCNTKGNLLVALLRGLGIKSRFHGFTIDKKLQRGAILWWMYPMAPREILHSWVEAEYEGSWVPLEGFILDETYLGALQRKFASAQGEFCGYGVATPDLHNPKVVWEGEPTYIQREGIVQDFGVYAHPDDLYREKGSNLSGVRRELYANILRHMMNARVQRIREAG